MTFSPGGHHGCEIPRESDPQPLSERVRTMVRVLVLTTASSACCVHHCPRAEKEARDQPGSGEAHSQGPVRKRVTSRAPERMAGDHSQKPRVAGPQAPGGKDLGQQGKGLAEIGNRIRSRWRLAKLLSQTRLGVTGPCISARLCHILQPCRGQVQAVAPTVLRALPSRGICPFLTQAVMTDEVILVWC